MQANENSSGNLIVRFFNDDDLTESETVELENLLQRCATCRDTLNSLLYDEQLETLLMAHREPVPEISWSAEEAALGENLHGKVLARLADDERVVAPPAVIDDFGSYREISFHARGGLSDVYIAFHTVIRRRVILKIARPERPCHMELESDIIRELIHPNIVRILDAGVLMVDDLETAYIAMELLDESLADQLERRLDSFGLHVEGLSTNVSSEIVVKTLGLMSSLAAGIGHLHETGIAHRDLKPQNIMFGDGIPQIIDFNLATRFDQPHGEKWHVGGTLPYMGPERIDAKDEACDPRLFDIYSFGVIFYECLVGTPPFQGPKQQLKSKILSEIPASLRSQNSSVSKDLEAIVFKCLEKNPTERYQSMDQVVADLSRLEKGEPVSARKLNPVTLAMRRSWLICKKRPRQVASVVILFAALTIGLGFLRYREWLTTEFLKAVQPINYSILNYLDRELSINGANRSRQLLVDMEEIGRKTLDFSGSNLQQRAQAHRHLGLVLRLGNEPNFDESLDHYRRSLAAYDSLLRSNASDPDALEGKVAVLTALGTEFPQSTEKRDALEQAFSLAAKACEQFPDKALFETSRLVSAYNLADYYKKSQDLQSAKRVLESVTDVGIDELEASKTSLLLARAYAALYDIERQLGNLDKGRQHLGTAVDIGTRANREVNDNQFATELVQWNEILAIPLDARFNALNGTVDLNFVSANGESDLREKTDAAVKILNELMVRVPRREAYYKVLRARMYALNRDCHLAMDDLTSAIQGSELDFPQGKTAALFFYNIGCVYSILSQTVLQDNDLSPAEQQELAAECTSKGVSYVSAVFLMSDEFGVDDLKSDSDLQPIKQHNDMSRFLSE